MSTIKREQILEKLEVCPYCMNEGSVETKGACCGEIHYEQAYLLDDGETLVLAAEVELI